MPVAEIQQMSFFTGGHYEIPPPPETNDANLAPLGLALIVLAWLPIALVIWVLT